MRLALALATAALLTTTLGATAASGATRAAQKLTVYAVPTTVQFMNHADDRLRGMSTNPFKLKAETALMAEADDLEARLGAAEAVRHVREMIAQAKRPIFYTQSLGPFQVPGRAAAVRPYFEQSPLILLRDEKSQRYLTMLGTAPAKMHVLADSVFAMARPETPGRCRCHGGHPQPEARDLCSAPDSESRRPSQWTSRRRPARRRHRRRGRVQRRSVQTAPTARVHRPRRRSDGSPDRPAPAR